MLRSIHSKAARPLLSMAHPALSRYGKLLKVGSSGAKAPPIISSGGFSGMAGRGFQVVVGVVETIRFERGWRSARGSGLYDEGAVLSQAVEYAAEKSQPGIAQAVE